MKRKAPKTSKGIRGLRGSVSVLEVLKGLNSSTFAPPPPYCLYCHREIKGGEKGYIKHNCDSRKKSFALYEKTPPAVLAEIWKLFKRR